MTRNSIAIEFRKVDDLKPYENSPRIHPPSQRRKAEAILQRHGMIAPILIDEQDRVVNGHLVLDAWKALGNKEIPVIVVKSRSRDDIRAIHLGFNRLAEGTKWDRIKLKAEFEALIEVGYDLDLTGFDNVEIDHALAVEDPTTGVVEDAPKAVDPTATPVSRVGDLFIAGKHRILCGDARDGDGLTRLMEHLKAHSALTDPPYNVKIDGNVSGLGKASHREFAMASGEMSSEAFEGFLLAFLMGTTACLVDGGLVYTFMDWRHLPELFAAYARAGLTPMNLCVWAKTNAGMGTFYRSQHEMVLIGKHGTAPHTNNFELGKKGRSRSNLWTYRGMNVVGRERDELLKVHPTVKPVAMFADILKDVTAPGEIVLDPFLGSGTTVIAAEETGRRCFGIELDPLYVDAIIRRFEDFTGQPVVHAETGLTFDQLRDARQSEEG